MRLSLLCGGPTKDRLSFVVVVSRIVVSDRDPLFIILSMKRKRNDFLLLLLLRMDFFFALNLVVGKFQCRLPADKCLSSLFYYVFSNENSDYLFKLLVRSSSFFFSLSLSRVSLLSLSPRNGGDQFLWGDFVCASFDLVCVVPVVVRTSASLSSLFSSEGEGRYYSFLLAFERRRTFDLSEYSC